MQEKVGWSGKQLQAHACSRCSALCVLYCVKAKEVGSFDAAGPTASLSLSQPKLLCGALTGTPLRTSLCLRISSFLLARPKGHASLSPFSESMEVSHSTNRPEPLTTC